MNKLSDFVREYENLIDIELCNKIINQKDLSFDPATTGDGKLNTHRNCYNKPLEDEFNDDIFQVIGKILKLYHEDQPWFVTGATTEDTGYTHLLYLGSKKGEPMVQVIPFKRESWKKWSGFIMERAHGKTLRLLESKFMDRYKKMFWNKKSFK